MLPKWLNEVVTDENGKVVEVKPNEQGDYVLQIYTDDGQRASTFKGKSLLGVIDSLTVAQMESTKTLGKLLRPDRGRATNFRSAPKPLSAADKERLAEAIIDPDKVVDAVTEIVTAAQGAPPSVVGKTLENIEQEQVENYYLGEVNAFKAENPDFYPVQQNAEAIDAYLKSQRWDLTRNNLKLAYQQLSREGRMIPHPAGDLPPQESDEEYAPPPPEVIAPPTRQNFEPRSTSTGLRASDSSASRPAPPKPKPLVTHEMLEKMSRVEYEQRRRSDPKFRAAVDALGPAY